MNAYNGLSIFMKRQKRVKNNTLFVLKNQSSSGCKGITLVEMMVAMIILSVFILAVGTILTSSWKFWNDGWQQVILQRDASYAFARIEKVVHGGSNATGSGSSLQVVNNGITYAFQLSGDTLQLTTGGNTENVASGVQSINFSTSGNTVSVTLTLMDGSSRVDFRTTIFLRNAL